MNVNIGLIFTDSIHFFFHVNPKIKEGLLRFVHDNILPSIWLDENW